MRIKLFACILIFLFIATLGSAATYYVDYVGGADTNNGTAIGTPFQHCPGDDEATDTAAATNLAADDIVVFEGGVTYVGKIDCDWSGSDGSPITYISGQNAPYTWGTGAAVASASGIAYAANTGAPFYVNTADYITIDGFAITNVPTGDYMGGVMANDPANNLIVQNCSITGGSMAVYLYGGWDIADPKTDTVSIHNCSMTANPRGGVLLRGEVDNVTITDCVIHDNTGNQADAIQTTIGGTGYPSSLTIRGCTLYNHPDKQNIMIYQTDSLTVEDNLFYGTAAAGHITIGSGDDLIIRNNVFYGTLPNAAYGMIQFNPQLAAHKCDNVQIFNNTIYCKDSYNYRVGINFVKGGSTQAPIFTNVDIRNNVIDLSIGGAARRCIYIGTDSGGTNPVVQLATLTCDYNAYNGPSDTPVFWWTGPTQISFADWKTAISDDANSNGGAIAYADLGSDDYSLDAADTKALDEGTDLSGQGFSDDIEGIARPQDGVWDIGAYEYPSTDVPVRRSRYKKELPAFLATAQIWGPLFAIDLTPQGIEIKYHYLCLLFIAVVYIYYRTKIRRK